MAGNAVQSSSESNPLELETYNLVQFSPNGNADWKKEHSTIVTIEDLADRVVSAKYVWTNSVSEPADSAFVESVANGDTMSHNGVSGTYYLWVFAETESGERLKLRSEGFNLDNAGPTINTFDYTAVNYSSFNLNMTATDNQSGIVEYEIFVAGTSQGKTALSEASPSVTKEISITNAAYGNNACYVIVTDRLGNTSRKDITAKTLMDTTGPNITAFTATKSSETAIALSATAQDTGTGVIKFEFYVDNVLKSTQTCTATTESVTKSYTATGLSTGSHSCKVIVYDTKDNSSEKTTTGATKLYTWERYSVNATYSYSYSVGSKAGSYNENPAQPAGGYRATFNYCTGTWIKGSQLYWCQMSGYSFCYTSSSRPYYYCYTGCWGCSSWNKRYNYDYYNIDVTSTPHYSKGSTKYSDVTSTNSSTYPSNGASGSYWYVYKGVY